MRVDQLPFALERHAERRPVGLLRRDIQLQGRQIRIGLVLLVGRLAAGIVEPPGRALLGERDEARRVVGVGRNIGQRRQLAGAIAEDRPDKRAARGRAAGRRSRARARAGPCRQMLTKLNSASSTASPASASAAPKVASAGSISSTFARRIRIDSTATASANSASRPDQAASRDIGSSKEGRRAMPDRFARPAQRLQISFSAAQSSSSISGCLGR